MMLSSICTRLVKEITKRNTSSHPLSRSRAISPYLRERNKMRIELPTKIKPISVWQANEKQWMETHPLRSAAPYTDENERRKALAEWGTPAAGVDYILRSAREAPTRKFPGTGGNVISHYTSKKMGKRLATESRRVEFPAVLKADFDGFTREFYCQPVQVAIPRIIRSEGRHGKKRSTAMTSHTRRTFFA